MKIVRFIHHGTESYGVLRENGEIIDLQKTANIRGFSVPSTINELVSLGQKAEALLKKSMKSLSNCGNAGNVLNKNDVDLKVPIINPPKIVCLGKNYRDHVEEVGGDFPGDPVIFMKPRTAIIGPEEPIIRPNLVKQLDYEVELAIIIGRKGKNIPFFDAENYIFGYTVFNDISARHIQFKDGQWTRGKSFDTFAPIGPCITTSRQIGDPNRLHLSTRVNGETRQNASTSMMIFNVHEIVHRLSRVMTLEPCDIIATGTPSGVGAFMKPKPKFLEPGDIVEVEVEKIGTLRNPIQKE